MGVGAIGAYQMSTAYIYNTNTVNRNSLNAIGKINNDVSRSHIEKPVSPYNGETVNPVPKGQSANFADILNSQMQMSMNNAGRIFGEDSVFA